MNLLENYLVRVHDIRPYNKKWDEGNDKKYLSVTATFECHGKAYTTTDIYSEEQWNDIKEKGYCMR